MVKIGMLGGIGPEATGNFYLELIKKLQDDGYIKENRDYPQIIINSIPAPELIHRNISKELLDPYMKGIKELEENNVDLIAMICNTIHIYHSMVQEHTKVPIINLRNEVREFLKEKGIKKVAVLGTIPTIDHGLYSFKDINYVEITQEEISRLQDAIFFFNKGVDKEIQRKTVKRIAQKCVNNGAEILILGCTELSLLLKEATFQTVDTMEILRNAVIRKTTNV